MSAGRKIVARDEAGDVNSQQTPVSRNSTSTLPWTARSIIETMTLCPKPLAGGRSDSRTTFFAPVHDEFWCLAGLDDAPVDSYATGVIGQRAVFGGIGGQFIQDHPDALRRLLNSDASLIADRQRRLRAICRQGIMSNPSGLIIDAIISLIIACVKSLTDIDQPRRKRAGTPV